MTRFQRQGSLNFGSEDSSSILLFNELFGSHSGLHQEVASSVIFVSYPSGRALSSPKTTGSQQVLTATGPIFRSSLSKIFRSCFLAKIGHSSVDFDKTFALGIIVLRGIAVVPIYTLPISSLAPSRSQLSFSNLATLNNKPLTLVSVLIFCSSCAT